MSANHTVAAPEVLSATGKSFKSDHKSSSRKSVTKALFNNLASHSGERKFLMQSLDSTEKTRTNLLATMP